MSRPTFSFLMEERGRVAGRQIVVEKKLEGEELSILALVAGRTIIPLAPSQEGILFHHLFNEQRGDVYVRSMVLSVSSRQRRWC